MPFHSILQVKDVLEAKPDDSVTNFRTRKEIARRIAQADSIICRIKTLKGIRIEKKRHNVREYFLPLTLKSMVLKTFGGDLLLRTFPSHHYVIRRKLAVNYHK